MAKVLYPGSFDPITKGHMNIINQATELFDEVYVAVLQNSAKKTSFFTLEERVKLIQDYYKDTEKIKVITGTGAAVDIATYYGCSAIVRGLRSLSDYDYEVQLQQINKDISNNTINTVCLFADKEYQFISSSVVKEVFGLNKDISKYVDASIEKAMTRKRVK